MLTSGFTGEKGADNGNCKVSLSFSISIISVYGFVSSSSDGISCSSTVIDDDDTALSMSYNMEVEVYEE